MKIKVKGFDPRQREILGKLLHNLVVVIVGAMFGVELWAKTFFSLRLLFGSIALLFAAYGILLQNETKGGKDD